MCELVTKHSKLYEYLCNGGFSTQLFNANPFGKIPVDHAIEETINKDTQTAGGIKRFSIKASVVTKYNITSAYWSSCVRMMRQMVEMQREGLNHLDLRSSKRKRERERCQITNRNA